MWRALIVLCVGLCVAPGAALAKTKPRISIAEARSIALARVPGKIVHEKLKTKKKKSHYNIKITPLQNAKLHYVEKVQIDGETGKILEVKQVIDKTNPPKDAGKKTKKSDDDDDND
jgi:hypothetical protein